MENKKNKWIIILIIILTLTIGYIIYDKFFTKNALSNKETTNEEELTQKYDGQERNGTKLFIIKETYKLNDNKENTYYSISDKEEVSDQYGTRELVKTFICFNECDFGNRFIYDNKEAYYYDEDKNELMSMTLEKEIKKDDNEFNLFKLNNHYLIGTTIKGKYVFGMSTGVNETITINEKEYSDDLYSISTTYTNLKNDGIYIINNNNYSYLMDSNNNKKLYDLERDNNYQSYNIITNGHLSLIEKLNLDWISQVMLLDKDYNVILTSDTRDGYYNLTKDGLGIINVKKETVTENGYSYEKIITTDTTYTIYGNDGKEKYTSKKYDDIKILTSGYVLAVDDGKLVLLEQKDGNKVAEFTTWNSDNMYVHTALSGWYEENKKEGVYFIVEDKSITKEEAEGRLEKGDIDSGMPLAYEYYYIPKTKETGKLYTVVGGYAKPMLYLYPESDNTKISVKFEKEDILTTTYPKYNNGWAISVNKDGNIYDGKRNYYGLYWEEKGSTNISFNEGFYVTEDTALTFLEEKLDLLGLTERESNEFITYWLPILEKNKKSLVYFELTDSREKYNKLLIDPKPDSLLRVAIHIKKVDEVTKIKEQKLPTFKRVGFTVVEWGGVIHK